MRKLFFLGLAWTIGCVGVGSDEVGAETDELWARGLGRVGITNAGELNGAMVRIHWEGPACDDQQCFVQMDDGSGTRDLRNGKDFFYINSQYRVIHVAGLRFGHRYEFRLMRSAIETALSDGFASSTSGSLTSDLLRITTHPQPYEVGITVRNVGQERSPFMPTQTDQSSTMYAYIDRDRDGYIGLPMFLPDVADFGGGPFFTDEIQDSRGPAFPVSFTKGIGGTAGDYANLHSNRLASDQTGRVANFIAFADFDSWTIQDRPHFVALHAEIDPVSGALISPVELVAGDRCQVGADSRPECQRRRNTDMVVLSRGGEPPRCVRWDPIHTSRGVLSGIHGECSGALQFTPPHGIPYYAVVDFVFSMDVQPM